MPGFPVATSEPTSALGLAVADLDGDGRAEIIATSGQDLVAINGDGAMLSGFPVGLRQAADKGTVALQGTPVVCDLDGDGRLDVALGDAQKRVFAVNAAGAMLAGFPVLLSGAVKGSLACLEDGGRRHLVGLTATGQLVGIVAGQVKMLARVAPDGESGVAVGDLNGDRKVELFAVGGDSRLVAVGLDGKAVPGFDYRMSFRVGGTPAVGDIDDDGRPEVLVGSQDFKIHAVGMNGQSLRGFPVATGYRLYAGVSLVDLDGDGVTEVVAGSGDSKVYAVRGDGSALKGFPVQLDGRIIADVIGADFNRDGQQEIAVVTQAGSVFVLNGKAQRIKGFPVRLGSKIETAPAAADLDGDGVPELVVQERDGPVHAFRFTKLGKAEKALVSWGMAGHDAGHTGRFGPTEGRFKDLALTQPTPYTTDDLEASYRFFDLDGDAEGSTQIRWYKNGKLQDALNNQRKVPAAATKKHEKWHYTLQDGSNHDAYGERGVLARVVQSDAVAIRNTRPTAPAIELSPKEPLTTAKLQVAVTTPSADADGDTVVYRYEWLRNGKPKKYATGQTSVPPADTRKNEEWRVVVVPYDGEEEGAPSTAVVDVLNTPPGAPEIALSPAAPTVDSAIEVSIRKDAPDDDRDPLTYSYRYFVNDVPLDLPAASATVPARALRKHQTLRVEVTAHDDELPGGKTESKTVVLNTPPPPPVVSIWPPSPGTQQDLVLAMQEQTPDRDADAVVWRHQWFRDGQKVDFPTRVPKTETKKGQVWRVEVTPFDGEVTGKPAAAETKVQNTPPAPPMVVLGARVFRTTQEVVPEVVEPARDDDGDPVRLEYRWRKNGKPAGLPTDRVALAASDTRKGERWEVDVVPHDGTVFGVVRTLQLEIENTPPGAPEVRLSSTHPTTVDEVKVSLVKGAEDVDGDQLTYRYRWFRNGQPYTADEPKPRAKRKRAASWEPRGVLPAGAGKKGEVWRVQVTAHDGEREGPPAAAELVFENHAPPAPAVALEPERPTVTMPVRCVVQRPALDPDGDSVTYHYTWLLNGEPLSWTRAADTLPANLLRKGQKWSCVVVASDGELTSTSAQSAAVTVLNTPPTAPVVRLAPTRPVTTSELACELAQVSEDADLDALSYDYAWKANGKPWQASKDAPNRVPPRALKKGQTWTCTVTPKDGDTNGPAGSAQIKIENSEPTAPKVHLEPVRPKAGEEILCAITNASEDADGDRVQYQYVWLKDGLRQSFAASSTKVPARLVKAKDVWRCQVTPTDGTGEGRTVESLDVLVE